MNRPKAEPAKASRNAIPARSSAAISVNRAHLFRDLNLDTTLLTVADTGDEAIIARGRDVIQTEAQALETLAATLDDSFVAACRLIIKSARHVVVTGMGKSGHIARKIAATLSATGTPAVFLHPSEAAHGDLGMLIRGDTLMVLSNSGDTPELRPVLRYARQLDIPVIGVASRVQSMVMRQATVALQLPALREACAANVAPTTSTALQLALGDALALAIMDLRGMSHGNLRSFHPGGAIGLRLTPVRDIMRMTDSLPLIVVSSPMRDAIHAITTGGLGIVGVTDEKHNLVGVITDGDLRRHFDRLASAVAADVMNADPKTVQLDMMAEDALMLLNEHKITAAFVVERRQSSSPNRPVGIVHMHDFIHLGLG